MLAGNGVLMDAFYTDVRADLAGVARGTAACPPIRWRRTRTSGYAERIVAERVGGTQAGWGP